jgi:hypothetical protein
MSVSLCFTVLWRRCFAQAQAAGEAAGRKEAFAAIWCCFSANRYFPRASEALEFNVGCWSDCQLRQRSQHDMFTTKEQRLQSPRTFSVP